MKSIQTLISAVQGPVTSERGGGTEGLVIGQKHTFDPAEIVEMLLLVNVGGGKGGQPGQETL